MAVHTATSPEMVSDGTIGRPRSTGAAEADNILPTTEAGKPTRADPLLDGGPDLLGGGDGVVHVAGERLRLAGRGGQVAQRRIGVG